MEREDKIAQFATAILDCFRDEEKRELYAFPKLEMSDESITDDFTDMLVALCVVYSQITNDDCDLIGFTHILNRLAVQSIMESEG